MPRPNNLNPYLWNDVIPRRAHNRLPGGDLSLLLAAGMIMVGGAALWASCAAQPQALTPDIAPTPSHAPQFQGPEASPPPTPVTR